MSTRSLKTRSNTLRLWRRWSRSGDRDASGWGRAVTPKVEVRRLWHLRSRSKIMAVMPKVEVGRPWRLRSRSGTYDRKSADEAKAEPNYVSNQRDFDYNPESRLHCYRATMVIDTLEKSSTEQRISKKREIVVSEQPSPTDKSKAPREAVYRDTPRSRQTSLPSLPRSRPRFYWSRLLSNYEVDRMVTEADFERRFPNQDASTSQCRVLMTAAARYTLQSMRKHCTELRQR